MSLYFCRSPDMFLICGMMGGYAGLYGAYTLLFASSQA